MDTKIKEYTCVSQCSHYAKWSVNLQLYIRW